MTVSTTHASKEYTAAGVATFAVDFQYLDPTHVWAVVFAADGVAVSYEYQGSNTRIVSGVFTVSPTPPAGHLVRIERRTPKTQTLDAEYRRALPATSVEAQLDRLTMVDQEAEEEIGRLDGVAPAPTPDPDPVPELTYGNWIEDAFTGNGTTTSFTLSDTPGSLASVFAVVGATLQGGSDFSLAGAVLTFVTAPPNGAPVRIKYGSTQAVGTSDATQVTFTQPTGLTRSLQSKLQESISVGDFTTSFAGATDVTIPLQAAIDATPTGGVLEVPDGVVKYISLVISKAITLRGRGRKGTYLRCSSATGDGITITTTDAVNLEDMTLDASVTRTAGAAIKVNPASSFNGNSSFKRVNILNAFVGIDFVKAADFTLDDCYFGSYLSKAVMVRNTDTPDAGDSAILNCTFDGAAGAVGVHQSSSGGLRIQGNKFLAGAYQYLGEFNSGASSTSILLIQGNSFENATAANIAFNSTGATGFAKIQIQNNQLSVAAAAAGISISDPGYDYLDIVTIDGNQVALGAGATGLNAGRCARLDLGANGWFGQGASITAITLGSNMGVSRIAPQTILNCATEFAGTYTLAEFNPPRVEGGQQAGVTCSTVYGTAAYASAATAVTFARQFAKAPSVHAIALASGGGLSVLINSVTPTGFTYTAISVTNGGSVPVVWSAQG